LKIDAIIKITIAATEIKNTHLRGGLIIKIIKRHRKIGCFECEVSFTYRTNNKNNNGALSSCVFKTANFIKPGSTPIKITIVEPRFYFLYPSPLFFISP